MPVMMNRDLRRAGFSLSCSPCLFLLVLLALAVPTLSATKSSGPAGHWEGEIQLPTTPLNIRVDLAAAAGTNWTGTIDIPVQGLHGFKLNAVEVKGQAISFAMPGIPGDPRFSGQLASSGDQISGQFSQAGQAFPFKLERKAKTATMGETPTRGQPGKGLAGYWQGSLKPTPVIELRLVLEVTNGPANKLAAVLISVDQGSARIPVTTLEEKEGNVKLQIPRIDGGFDGKLSADGSEISGEWKQGGSTLPLVFKRLKKAPSFSRSQEPKKPYPYQEEEVTIENPSAQVELAGTFTCPREPGPHPAVVLITGSGAQDRDEAIMGHRPFLVLADHLTRHGIAVLRCDDRGFAKSTGNFTKATETDFVSDTLAQVNYLRVRKEVDPKKIGLIGHSEGGTIAPRAAVKSPDIAFIVLMAGVGVPAEQLLVRQAQDIARVMGAGQAEIDKNTALQRESFALVKQAKDPAELEQKLRALVKERTSELNEDQRKALGLSDALVEQQMQMVRTPWFRDLLAYDPVATLKLVKCPVLAINGEKDLQVAAKENLAAIRDALLAGGNKNVKTVELPGLNHLFQTCQTGAVTEYSQIEETFNPKALNLISDWILQTVGK